MTSYYEIPLSPKPQTLSITLAGTEYQFTVRWNVPNASWVVDIADSTGVPILSGIPVVTGCNLLEQYGYLAFGFQLVAQTDSAPDVVPTFEGMGTTGHLYVVVP